ncbi:MAG: hypothetical protein ACI814_002943 [Mariniblastus sp.]|jgi:hypothetical protein
MVLRTSQLKTFNQAWRLSGLLMCWSVVVCGCNKSDSANQNFSQDSKSSSSASVSQLSNLKSATSQVAEIQDGDERSDQVPGVAVENSLRPSRLYLNDKHSPDSPVDAGGLEDNEIHKNFTILMLAHEPDLRARTLTKHLRHMMTDEQMAAAVELVLKNDHKFQKLIRRRAEVLEYAYDGLNIQSELRRIDEETILVSRDIRNMVNREILTREQKMQFADQQKKIVDERERLNSEEETKQ